MFAVNNFTCTCSFKFRFCDITLYYEIKVLRKIVFQVVSRTKAIKMEGENEKHFLKKFKNENFSKRFSFKSIKQFLKDFKKLVKFKTSYLLQTTENVVVRKNWFS